MKTSAHGLIIDQNKFLLTQRQDVHLWVMPGGTVEKGETTENALVREIKEETGYLVSIDHLALVTKLSSSIKYVYICHITGGKEHLDPHEVNRAVWVSINKLPKPISLFEKSRIQKVHKMNKNPIYEDIKINLFLEAMHQFKNPLSLIEVLMAYITNKVKRS